MPLEGAQTKWRHVRIGMRANDRQSRRAAVRANFQSCPVLEALRGAAIDRRAVVRAGAIKSPNRAKL
jgi:hypothetical protein